MNKKIFQKVFLILAVVGAFFAIAHTAMAVTQFQVQWPEFEGVQPMKSGKTVALPAFVNYILRLCLAVCAFLIFGIMVWAGYEYITSSGDPSKNSDSKARIIQAFLGMLILLGAFLILNTINPELTKLKLDTNTSGVIVQGTGEETILVPVAIENMGAQKTHIADSQGNLTQVPFVPELIKIPVSYRTSTEITLYSSPNFSQNSTIKIIKETDWNCDTKVCTTPYPSQYTKGSMTVLWLLPGVFIFKDGTIPYRLGVDVSDVNDLNDFRDLSGVVDSVKIYNDKNSQWGTLAFQSTNHNGAGMLFLPPAKEGWSDLQKVGDIRSLQIFNVKKSSKPTAQLYYGPEYNYESPCDTPAATLGTYDRIQLDKIVCGPENFVYSLKTGGGWLILLAVEPKSVLDNPERAQYYTKYLLTVSGQLKPGAQPFALAELFKVNDPNLDDNTEIGQCLCNGRFAGIFWCVNWQSCADRVFRFYRQ